MKSYRGEALWAYFLVVLHLIEGICNQDDWRLWLHMCALVIVILNMISIWWDYE